MANLGKKLEKTELEWLLVRNVFIHQDVVQQNQVEAFLLARILQFMLFAVLSVKMRIKPI